jgi:hypothetical protein
MSAVNSDVAAIFSARSRVKVIQSSERRAELHSNRVETTERCTLSLSLLPPSEPRFGSLQASLIDVERIVTTY